jgi:hypothetical protein
VSLFSVRQPGGSGVQQWASAVAVGKSLKDLYASQGDVTLTGANTVATLLDGPEKVVRFGNLVLGDGTTATSLTATSRCKGLTVICDNLTVKNNASLNMTARGARVFTNDDPFFPFVDFKIPNQITLNSNQATLAQALAVIRQNGFAPWDQGTFQTVVAAMFGFSLSVSQAGTLALMLASGCGASGGGVVASGGYTYGVTGTTGGAGTSGGCGGGGAGGAYANGGGSTSSSGGYGCPYSGGSGGGGADGDQIHSMMSSFGSKYSGPGGAGGGGTGYGGVRGSFMGDTPAYAYCGAGAGNPGGSGGYTGGSGTGGKLVIICYGAITVQSGGKIEANGVTGGGGGRVAGGGSGGGHISIIAPTLANSGTIQAAGGSSGAASLAGGGYGGAGSVVTKTFTDMGWT